MFIELSVMYQGLRLIVLLIVTLNICGLSNHCSYGKYRYSYWDIKRVEGCIAHVSHIPDADEFINMSQKFIVNFKINFRGRELMWIVFNCGGISWFGGGGSFKHITLTECLVVMRVDFFPKHRLKYCFMRMEHLLV